MSTPKSQETQDAELIALAAMAQVDAVTMAGDNQARELRGECPMWTEGCGYYPATTALYNELRRRGLIP